MRSDTSSPNSDRTAEVSRPIPVNEDLDWYRLGPILLALAAAIVLGASSQRPPASDLIIQILAGLALLTAVLRGGRGAPSQAAYVLAAAIVLIPAIQLVPLPGAIWRLAASSRHWIAIEPFVGESDWRPMTLHYEATVSALLGAMACSALFLASTLLREAERRKVIEAIVVLACVSAVLGLLQLQTGARILYLHADAVPGSMTGFFGNRNHQGDFLVVAAGLSTALAGANRRSAGWTVAAGTLVALFAAAALSTQSRSALVLLTLVTVGLVVVRFRSSPVLLLAGIGASAALAFAASYNPVVSSLLARFDGGSLKLNRTTIWTQAAAMIEETFPLGSGIGTFREFYQTMEPLDLLSQVFVNHAHNDLLQLTEEGGIVGLAGLAVALIVLAGLGWKTFSDRSRVLGQTALVCLCAPLLHSLVDYPLRTMALGGIAAVLAAFLVPALDSFRFRLNRNESGNPLSAVISEPAGDATCLEITLARSDPDRDASPRRALSRSLVLPPIVAVMVLSLSSNLSGIFLAAGQSGIAAGLAPYSSAARLAMAGQAEKRGDPTNARRHAVAALTRNALSADALAAIGRVAMAEERPDEADAAFLAAAHLGWRNPSVQSYVFTRASQTGAAETAAAAADALLRQDFDEGRILSSVNAMIGDPSFRRAFAERAEKQPPWLKELVRAMKPATPGKAAEQLAFLGMLDTHSFPREVLEELGSLYVEGAVRSGGTLNLLAAWRAIHPGTPDPSTGVLDSRFARGAQGMFPFGWQLDPALTGRAAVPAGNGLTLRNYTGRRGVAGLQYLVLPSGEYRLSLATDGTTVDGRHPLVRLRCVGGRMLRWKREPGRAPTADDPTVIRRFAIAPHGCAAQKLELIADTAGDQSSPIRVVRVAIDPQ